MADELTLSAGTATFGSTLGAASLAQDAGILNLNGAVTLEGDSTLRTVNLGNITLQNGDSAITTLAGTFTSTGKTTVKSGVIALNTGNNLNAQSGTLTLDGDVDLLDDGLIQGAGQTVVLGDVSGPFALLLDGSGGKSFGQASKSVDIKNIQALVQADNSGDVAFF